MRPSPARHLLILLVMINMLNYFDRYVIAAILEPLGKDLQLSDTQLGRFPFVFLVVYMLAAPFVGMIANRMSRTRLIGLAIGLWSLATAGAAFANTYGQLLLSRSLLGIGEAVYATLGPAILCDMYAERDRAAKFTWFYLAIPVGSAIGFGVSGVIASMYGWRASFLVAGIPGLLAAWLISRQDDPPKGRFDLATTSDNTPQSYLTLAKAVLQNRTWLVCTISYVAYTFAMGALTHWFPTMVQRRFAVSTGEAGMVFGGIAVVTGILGTFAGGWVCKRWQDRYPNIGLSSSLVTLALAAPMVYASLQTASLGLCYASITLAMVLLFFNTSPINAITVSAVNAMERPVATSLNVFLIHIFGDAISPEIVGRHSEAMGSTGDSLATALTITVPAVFISGLVLLLAIRSRPMPLAQSGEPGAAA